MIDANDVRRISAKVATERIREARKQGQQWLDEVVEPQILEAARQGEEYCFIDIDIHALSVQTIISLLREAQYSASLVCGNTKLKISWC